MSFYDNQFNGKDIINSVKFTWIKTLLSGAQFIKKM